MAEKKKKKMEFRYYQLPPGSPILALLGEKWVQNYGDRTADRLHFHNYMELGYCYYGAGDVVFSRTMHSAKSAHCSGSMKSRGFWRKQSIRRKRQKLKKS